MPKRLHDTEIWRKSWFRKLSAECKLLWMYMKDNCNCAGIIEMDDMDQISFFLGKKINNKHLIQFSDRIKKIDSKRYVLVDFIDFQYGHLSDTHKMSKKIFSELAKFDLKYPIDTVSIQLADTVIDIDKDIDKDISKDKDKRRDTVYCDNFLEFWNIYPNKKEKLDASRKYKNALKETTHDKIMEGASKYRDHIHRTGSEYVKYPSRWLNAGCWEDDYSPVEKPKERWELEAEEYERRKLESNLTV